MKNKFKIGDKIKVISQGWKNPSLVGQTGIVEHILNERYPGDEIEYLIYFDNWFKGHDGNGYGLKKGRNNYWYMGGKEEDELKKAEQQLEFNFGT